MQDRTTQLSLSRRSLLGAASLAGLSTALAAAPAAAQTPVTAAGTARGLVIWGSSSAAGGLGHQHPAGYRRSYIHDLLPQLLGAESMVTTGIGGDTSYQTLSMRSVNYPYKPYFHYNGQGGKVQTQGHIILSTTDNRVPNWRVALPGHILGVPCTIKAVRDRSAKVIVERQDIGPQVHVGGGAGGWWRTGLEALHRGKTHLIWAGKNNIRDYNRVLSDTRTIYHTEPETTVVMGHWYAWADRRGTTARTYVDRVNTDYRHEYGHRYFDAQAALCDPELWSVPELAPYRIGTSAEDQYWLSLGLPPRSVVGTDNVHLNALGNTLVAYGLHRFLTGTAGLY